MLVGQVGASSGRERAAWPRSAASSGGTRLDQRGPPNGSGAHEPVSHQEGRCGQEPNRYDTRHPRVRHTAYPGLYGEHALPTAAHTRPTAMRQPADRLAGLACRREHPRGTRRLRLGLDRGRHRRPARWPSAASGALERCSARLRMAWRDSNKCTILRHIRGWHRLKPTDLGVVN
jgi:hypothetical protein